MEKTKKSSILVLVLLIVIVLGIGTYFLISKLEKKKTVVVPKTTYPWEASVEKYYNDATQVEPDAKVKNLSDDLTPIIKDTLKADVKLSESTDKKIVYVAKTIIVEGDVNSIKTALEAKGYQDVAVTDQYKKLTAKKDDKTITMTFSVDTVNQGKIEVIISS